MNIQDEIQIDKHIDPDAIDVAWIEQAGLYYKYSDLLNNALEKRNNLKTIVEEKEDEIKAIKAELDLDIRNNPEDFEIAKLTEGAISAAILIHKKYKKAINELYDLKKEFNTAQDTVNRLYSCVHTMEQRKVALENLVRLLNQQYFSTPEEPRDLSKEYHNKVKKIKEGAKERVKKRRKK